MKGTATLVVLAACSVFAVPPRSYPCYRLPAAPIMDGHPDDTSWKAARSSIPCPSSAVTLRLQDHYVFKTF